MMKARLSDIIRRWGAHISFSLVDQALFSGANFLLNILLARWLLPETYGAFAVAFSVFLFLAGFHSALLIEPMSVLGPSRYAAQARRYFGHLLWMHVGLMAGLSLVLFVAAFAFLQASPDVAFGLWGVALAQPLILFFWLLRRACYIERKITTALGGSGLYNVLLLSGLFLLYVKAWLTPLNAFLIVGAASLGAGLVVWRRFLGTMPGAASDAPALPLRAVLKAHWNYGRWTTGASVAHSFSTVIFAPLVATFLGLAQAGAFRAIQVLVTPILQVIIALGTLLLPWMSKRHAEEGMPVLRGIIRKATLLNVSVVLSMALVLLVFSKEIITLVYADAYYTELRWLMVYFVGATLLVGLSQPVALALRAIEKPSAILWSKLGAMAGVVLVGLPLIWQTGLAGAGLCVVLAALAETVVLVFCMKKLGSRPMPASNPDPLSTHQ